MALIELQLSTPHSSEIIQSRLDALTEWIWTRSESGYLGLHWVGRHQSEPFRMDIIPAGLPQRYDVSIEFTDPSLKPLANKLMNQVLVVFNDPAPISERSYASLNVDGVMDLIQNGKAAAYDYEPAKPNEGAFRVTFKNGVPCIEPWGTLMNTWNADAVLEELKKELHPAHPLFEQKDQLKVLWQCESSDDVLFENTHDHSVHSVHLTWTGKPEQEGFPSSSSYADLKQWLMEELLPLNSRYEK